MVQVNFVDPRTSCMTQNYHEDAVKFGDDYGNLYLYDVNDNKIAVYADDTWHSAEVIEDD